MSATIAGTLACSAILSTAPAVLAAEAPSLEPAGAPTTAAAVPETTVSPIEVPAGATEVTAKRDRFATHYRLPNGRGLAVISAAPVHYEEDGAWQDIDTRMLLAGPETYRNAANDFEIEMGPQDGGAPVSISKGSWNVSLDLLGQTEGEPLVVGSSATYLDANATLAYDSGPAGLKETIYLASAAAPNTYVFSLDTSGCALSGDASVGYRLVQRGAPHPVGELTPLIVIDSASTPAECPSATMVVTPTSNGALVTYRIPPSWMADPTRIFPIRVDPGISIDNPEDTLICADQPTYTYYTNTRELLGNQGTSTLGWRRSFIKFNLTSLYGANVTAATMNLHYVTGSAATIGALVERPIVNWQDHVLTWGNQPGSAVSVTSKTIGGTTPKWDSFDVASAIQYYIGMTTGVLQTNCGFRLRTTEGTAGFSHYYQYDSADAASNKPYLAVTYSQPTASAVQVPTSPIIADGAQQATVKVRVAYPDPTKVCGIYVSATTASGAHAGDFYWDEFGTPNCPGGGAVALDPSDGQNPDIAVVPSACSMATETGARVLTLAYRAGPNYTNLQNVHYAVEVIDTAASESMARAWQDMMWGDTWALGGNLTVLPGPTTISSTESTAQGFGWWQPLDADHNGVIDNPADSGADGRGCVNLRWPAAGASVIGYNVYLQDGYAWRKVGSTPSSVTTWTSQGKGLYPTDTAINAMASNSTANPFLAGGGLELRDDPAALYAKTAGTTHDGTSSYHFKVVPYNSVGETDSGSCGQWSAALPSRSRAIGAPVLSDPQPSDGASLSIAPMQLSVSVDSSAPVVLVSALVDGAPAEAVQTTDSVAIATPVLAAGPHAVTVIAVDTLGREGSVSWGFETRGGSLSAAAAVAAKPVVVFVVGWTDTQKEYGGDRYSDTTVLKANMEEGPPSTFGDMIAKLDSSGANLYQIVKAPSQRTSVAASGRIIDPRGDVFANGDALGLYLENHPKIQQSNNVVLVTHSLGGAIARAMLDSYCSLQGHQALRNRIRGVIQLGTPNNGSDWADNYVDMWRVRVAHDHPGWSSSQVENYLWATDAAVLEMKPSWMLGGFDYLCMNSYDKPYDRFSGRIKDDKNIAQKPTNDGLVLASSAYGPDFLFGPGDKASTALGVGTINQLDNGVHSLSIKLGKWAPLWKVIGGLSSGSTCIVPGKSTGTQSTAFLNLIGGRLARRSGIRWPGLSFAKALATMNAELDPESTMVPPGADARSVAAVEGTYSPSVGATITATLGGAVDILVTPADSSVVLRGPDGEVIPLVATINPGEDASMPSFAVQRASVETTGVCTVAVCGGSGSGGWIRVSEPGGVSLAATSDASVPVDTSVTVTAEVVDEVGHRRTDATVQAKTPHGQVVALHDDGIYPDASPGDGSFCAEVRSGPSGVQSAVLDASIPCSECPPTSRTTRVSWIVTDGGVHVSGTPTIALMAVVGGVRDGISLSVPIVNDSTERKCVRVACEVSDAGGALVACPSADVTVAAGESTSAELSVSGQDLFRGLSHDGLLSVGCVWIRQSQPGPALASSSSTPNSDEVFVNRSQLAHRLVSFDEDSSLVSRSSSVTVSGIASTNGSSIGGVEISLDDGCTWLPAQSSDGAFDSPIEPFYANLTFPQGQWKVLARPTSAGSAWTRDEWGEAPVIVDGVEPSASDDAEPSYAGTASITVTAWDPHAEGQSGSGIDEVQWALDGGVPQSVGPTGDASSTAIVECADPGPHVLRYRATDRAGNSGPWIERSFAIYE